MPSRRLARLGSVVPPSPENTSSESSFKVQSDAASCTLGTSAVRTPTSAPALEPTDRRGLPASRRRWGQSDGRAARIIRVEATPDVNEVLGLPQGPNTMVSLGLTMSR